MKAPRQAEKIVIAIDIGGTKIAIAAVTADGRILSRLTAPTQQKGPEKGIQQIINLIEALITKINLSPGQVLGIGIGIPAVLENETDFIIWGPNLNGWKNVDLRGSLEHYFKLPVCIEYDGIPLF
jgi:glucokinase